MTAEPHCANGHRLCITPKTLKTTHGPYRRWRGKLEGVTLENEVDIICKLYTFSARQSEETVVIKHAIEGLNPLRINVAIANDPRVLLKRLFDDLP